MPLEATMICLDNSDWMRNGDYAPSRMESQQDAAGILCNDRTSSNPENTVGILTMAGNGVDMLVSPTEENGKILASFAGITIGGKTDLSTAVQIAQLALKHRKNKNGGQRVIAFVGGPVTEDVAKLKKIGKQLKKNNVAIDIISMGELDENSEKLLELINATNSNDNSHLITVPAGVSPANAIAPILHTGGLMAGGGGGAVAGGGGGGGGGDFDMYGGVDPELDPELAMALRVSAEEARAHEEARVATTSADAASASSGAEASSSSSSGAAAGSSSGAVGDDNEDEDALMQQALAMSMQEAMGAAGAEAASEGETSTEMANGVAGIALAEGEEDEDEDLRRAMALSVADTASAADASAPADALGAGFSDPAFVNQLLGTADQSDPLIQAAMQQLQHGQQQQGGEAEGQGEGGEGDKEAGKKRKGGDGE